MDGDASFTTKAGERALEITRDLNAPREQVFAAWTDPKRASRWWGPRDFTLLSCEMDVRPGGSWHRRMRAASGAIITKHGVYREVEAPARLVFTYITEDEAGVVDPETLVTITIADLGGRTRLTLRHTGFETDAACDDHRGGWIGAMERLADFIAPS